MKKRRKVVYQPTPDADPKHLEAIFDWLFRIALEEQQPKLPRPEKPEQPAQQLRLW